MQNIIKKEGYNYCFDANACDTCKGNCCIGESGYIWVTPIEINAMANLLGVDTNLFKEEYLIKVGYKFSIKEVKYNDGYACVFFDFERRGCKIYEARPKQCRTFPFWDYFKTHQDEVEAECPGILS